MLGKVRVLVLDEADEMLDLGFLPDIERILRDGAGASGRRCCSRPPCRARSSRWPGRFLRQPTHIRAEEHRRDRPSHADQQFVYRAHALDKVEMRGPGAAGRAAAA